MPDLQVADDAVALLPPHAAGGRGLQVLLSAHQQVPSRRVTTPARTAMVGVWFLGGGGGCKRWESDGGKGGVIVWTGCSGAGSTSASERLICCPEKTDAGRGRARQRETRLNDSQTIKSLGSVGQHGVSCYHWRH